MTTIDAEEVQGSARKRGGRDPVTEAIDLLGIDGLDVDDSGREAKAKEKPRLKLSSATVRLRRRRCAQLLPNSSQRCCSCSLVPGPWL